MATLGTLTRQDDNVYTGSFRTLSQSAPIRLVPLDKSDNERAPSHRIMTRNGSELGAAWTKFNQETGEEYLSLKIDTPEFSAPINANVGRMPGTAPEDGVFAIIWNRT